MVLFANESLSNEMFSAGKNTSTRSMPCDSIYKEQVEHQDLNLMWLRLLLPLYLRNVSNQDSAVVLIADEDTSANNVLNEAGDALKDKVKDELKNKANDVLKDKVSDELKDKTADELKDEASEMLKDKASEVLTQKVGIDPFGQPITEADIKSYMKSTTRYIMSSIYGTLFSMVGLSISDNKYLKIVSMLTGASVGSISGYLMGRYGDKRLAIYKVKKERLEDGMVNMTYDAISQKLNKDEAMKVYLKFRTEGFTPGIIVGGISGGTLGIVGTMLSADSFKGAMVGVLATGVVLAPGGAIAGYFIEREIDKNAAMEELNKLLKRKRDESSLYFERNHKAQKSKKPVFSEKTGFWRTETDYILRLVDLRF
jgi:outer membrane lipoprotein SlyB